MNGIWKKLLSLFLALTLALQLLPVQAMAAELQESESLTVEDQETTATEDANIVAEVPSGRDEFQKEFILSNGLRMISISGAAIHYQEDGEWKEIDNTLQPVSSAGVVLTGRAALTSTASYKNTAGMWDVKLPASLNANNAVEVSRDGYTLSFQFAGEIHNNHVVMSVGDETELSSVEAPVVESAQEELMEATASEELSELSETAEQETDISSAEGSEALNEASETVVADQAAANVTTQVNTVSAAVLDLSSTTSAAPQQEYMDKLYSAVTYSDIYSNTDLRYDLQSHQLKESVIIKAAKDTLAGYKYTLSAPGMVLELQEDNSILAYAADAEEGDEPIFYMPAPFLVDDNLFYNDNIAVSLQQSGDTYTLTYSLPRAWLLEEERAYPVVLDPVVQPKSGIYTISDQTVFSNGSKSYTWACLAVGHSTNLGIGRALIKFRNLPALTSADVIVGASLKIKKYASNSVTNTMEAHRVKELWESWDVTWADMATPDDAWDSKVEDYNQIKAAGWYTWDITNIAQQWYASGENTGVLFKLSDSGENTTAANLREFYASDWGGSVVPTLQIIYLNNCGLEDYWDYTSQSAGRAGTGYVNNFTGNLVWVHNGLSFAGNRMPVSISHVYNANDKSNLDNDDYDYGLGYGWRTNYNQQVYQWTENSSYYVWIDQDGTRRYFYIDSAGVYKNETDNTLVLTTTGSGDEKYCITDKNGNKSYFDTEGRLKKICNNQQTVSSITISYISSTSKLIDFITDGADRVYKFNYNLEDLLSSIEFMGTESDPITTLTYTYDSNSNLTGITYPDNQSVTYGYTTNHLLTSAEDVGGYKVTYAYNVTSTTEPNRVVEIKEFDGTTAGGSLDIEYAHNQTTFVDHNGNKEISQFNKYGSTVSIQDGQGRAQFAQYASVRDAKSASQLSLSSKLISTPGDPYPSIITEDFEQEGGWSESPNNASTGICQYSPYHYSGDASMEIERWENNTHFSMLSAAYPINPGDTCELSGYIMLSDTYSTGSGAYIALKLASNGQIVATSNSYNLSRDWTFEEIFYQHPATAPADSVIICLNNESRGSAFFDNITLERSTADNSNNLVSNGDFRNGTTGWAQNSSCTSADTVADENTSTDLLTSAAPQLDNSAYMIIGSATAAKTVSQTITLSGSKDDVFTLAGWAKGDSVPLSGDRKFGLAVTFIGSDGTAGEEHLLSFNPDSDSENNWQYAATRVLADKAYASVRVDLLYGNNQNTAYFDGIQLYKEEFGQSYEYDEVTGLVRSVIDLQQQRTSYEYDETTNDLLKIILPNNAEQTYTYDDYHNVLTATSPENVLTTFTYDTYGNNLSVGVGPNEGVNDLMAVYATYTDNGNLLSTITDTMEYTTTYGYNAQTGVLEWVQAPDETAATRTNYTYDNLYRTTKVSKSDASVTYTYENDLLDTITSGSGTVYDFAYTTFDLVQSVKAGNHALISHEYSDDGNFYLAKSTYGNGDYVSYSYDHLGRVESKSFEDGDTVSYVYDNNGNLGQTVDGGNGRTTKYYYDFQDRLSRYEETGTGYSNSVEWEYNTDNNLTSQTQTINGAEYTSAYTYDKDNRLTVQSQGSSSFYTAYDVLSRLNGLEVDHDSGTIAEYAVSYHEPLTSTTAAPIWTWSYSNPSSDTGIYYSYDYNSRGNLSSLYYEGALSSEPHSESYSYDSFGQLKNVYDATKNESWGYAYDKGGNILSKTRYTYEWDEYEMEQVPVAVETISYIYGDTDGWKDLLTNYNGQSLTYDSIGNLLTDGTWIYTWEHGRQLAQMTKSDQSGTIAYTYNSDGMRIAKTVDGTTYQYHYLGSQLVEMTWGSNKMSFIYNILGPAAVIYNGATYYFVVNPQGDVIAITDASGSIVVEYTYDVWGKLLNIDDDTASNLGTLNPLRYRGYVYDTETGLYYLQSRYYNPEWCRFISADEYISTGQGLLGNNMFAYCNNNPIIFADEDGQWGVALALGASAAICSIGGDIVGSRLSGKPINWISTAIKAVGVGFYAGLSYYHSWAKVLCDLIEACYAFFGAWISTRDVFAAMSALGCWFASDLLIGWCNLDDSALEILFEGFVTDAFGVAAEVPINETKERSAQIDAGLTYPPGRESHSDPDYSYTSPYNWYYC